MKNVQVRSSPAPFPTLVALMATAMSPPPVPTDEGKPSGRGSLVERLGRWLRQYGRPAAEQTLTSIDGGRLAHLQARERDVLRRYY